MRSGTVDVLATPRVIALCEQATLAAIDGRMPPGHTTVGMRVQIDHLQPTAVGDRGHRRGDAREDRRSPAHVHRVSVRYQRIGGRRKGHPCSGGGRPIQQQSALTRRVIAAAGVALSLVSLTACADGEAAERISDDLDVVDVDVASTGGASATDPGIFDQVNALTCDSDFKTLTLAVEAFTAMEGRQPQSEDELVGMFFREPSSVFDISPDGLVGASSRITVHLTSARQPRFDDRGYTSVGSVTTLTR